MNPAPRTTQEEWEEWPKEWIVRADLARELETQLTETKAMNKTGAERLQFVLTENTRLRAEVERLKKQIKDDNRSYGCELRDPNGTIWEQAAKDHARAEKAEAECVKWNRLLLMSRDDRENDLMSEIDEQARLLGLSANQNAILLTKVNNLSALWSQFIYIMDIIEESDSGNEFRPNRISSCRALDAQKMSDIIEKAKLVVNAGVKSEH